MPRFDECLKFVLAQEGGTSEPAGDPDTAYGVTQAIFDAYLKMHGQPSRDVDTITKEEVRLVYRDLFWLPSRADKLPTPVDLVHFDLAVNSGMGTAGRMLQQALNMTPVDGVVGPRTIAAVQSADALLVAARYAKLRLNHYIVLGAVSSGRPKLAGWAHRLGYLLLAL